MAARKHVLCRSVPDIRTAYIGFPYQNGISRLYNMLEIYHSGPEPSIFSQPTLANNDGKQQTLIGTMWVSARFVKLMEAIKQLNCSVNKSDRAE